MADFKSDDEFITEVLTKVSEGKLSVEQGLISIKSLVVQTERRASKEVRDDVYDQVASELLEVTLGFLSKTDSTVRRDMGNFLRERYMTPPPPPIEERK